MVGVFVGALVSVGARVLVAVGMAVLIGVGVFETMATMGMVVVVGSLGGGVFDGSIAGKIDPIAPLT